MKNPIRWRYSCARSFIASLRLAAILILCEARSFCADGDLDTSFNAGPNIDAGGYIGRVVVQPDGKLIVAGEFTVQGTNPFSLARFFSDGTLDTSFDAGLNLNAFVYAIALDPDGRLLVGGDFVSVHGTNRSSLARLNQDGSLDLSFDPGVGPNGKDVFELALQPDGKILVGGDFVTFNGTFSRSLARLQTNGVPDPAFNTGLGMIGNLNSICLQSDGKILVGGSFSTVNGTNRGNIARLHSNGGLDLSFDPGTGLNDAAAKIALQADGKVLVTGAFLRVNNVPRRGIARLFSNGSLDTTFNPPEPRDEAITLIVQWDQKILFGGDSAINGLRETRVMRYLPNGTLDPAYAIQSLDSAYVYSLALQADGKCLVVGDFFDFGGTGRDCIVRLHGEAGPALSLKASSTNVLASWPSAAAGFVLQKSPLLSSTNWQTEPTPANDDGTNRSVLLPVSGTNTFFRLSK